MGRLNLANIEPAETLTLDELIPVYAETKAELDICKKACENQNAMIKKQLEELKTDSYTAGGYVAKKSVQIKESINEDRLLFVLAKHGIKDVIKTKEYVDMDALESYLYNNEISEELASDMDSCREVKEVVQLRISREKRKEK